MEQIAESSVIFKGDVPPAVQRQIVEFSDFHIKDVSFAHSTGQRLVLTEASVHRRPEDRKLQSRVVYTTTVDHDMINRQNTMHGGCTAFIVDVCSSVGLAFLGMVQGKPADFVSQSIVATYHAPAPLGAKLSVVSTTTSFGARTVASRVEIWDVTHGRLCISGTHNKMVPKLPTPTPAGLAVGGAKL
ncbi:uncharacterized protein BXZ73DRAFT_55687 [Epithele typhae]|uniref:uncharacterized protein n=1 Tax=Epithele typhae TaxID=378194 RepID=UPI0020079C67|nr:uncharacterized protein BXZ73DRAFT_55687 [Epithele typhae]KAH9913087.1 hypothetical protein BXZ73DRAFT_55687 [Epithele typhae]